MNVYICKRRKICNKISTTLSALPCRIYHDKRRRRETKRDFIMHASRKETPDCEGKNNNTIHAPPETVVVKSETLIKR
jgi:hypothetical protein